MFALVLLLRDMTPHSLPCLGTLGIGWMTEVEELEVYLALWRVRGRACHITWMNVSFGTDAQSL